MSRDEAEILENGDYFCCETEDGYSALTKDPRSALKFALEMFPLKRLFFVHEYKDFVHNRHDRCIILVFTSRKQAIAWLGKVHE